MHINTTTAARIYAPAINGTTVSETFEILFIPPKVTIATNAVTITAVTINGTLNVAAAAAIELT